jgi:citrate synthase
MKQDYFVYKLSESIKTTSYIDTELFKKYNVKRGLRNEDHSGVLVGLTRIGDVVGYERTENGPLKAVPGKLIYRGVDVEDLTHGFQKEKRFGFEETIYLLLAGKFPDREDLDIFRKLINSCMPLEQKVKMSLLYLEGHNIMNILSRSVLEMYTCDEDPDNTSRENLMRQSLELIARFPTIIAYAYNIMRHSSQGLSLHIRHPKEGLSIAENFLYMLKGGNYTDLEAKILDIALVLHAEHGGGNNSTFTVRVTSSSGTDTYSAIAAAIGSLKGPLHGGANIEVQDQFEHLKNAIDNWNNVEEVDAYLYRMLNKEVFDKKGLIYGIGHAVYTISDPRALLLRDMARDLATEKGRENEFAFLELLDERAVKCFMDF